MSEATAVLSGEPTEIRRSASRQNSASRRATSPAKVTTSVNLPGMRHTVRNLEDLKPHPLNLKIYGDEPADEDLMKSMIHTHGVLHPITVNRNHEILSGTRRWTAAKEIARKHPEAAYRDLYGKFAIAVRIASDVDGAYGELFLLESNRQRVKSRPQKSREIVEMVRIEKELAAERRKARLKQNKKTDTPISAERGETSQIVGKKFGVGKEFVNQTVAIMQAAETGNPAAVAAVADYDAGKISMNAAHGQVTAKPTDCPKCGEHFDSKSAYSKHVRKTHPDMNVRPSATESPRNKNSASKMGDAQKVIFTIETTPIIRDAWKDAAKEAGLDTEAWAHGILVKAS